MGKFFAPNTHLFCNGQIILAVGIFIAAFFPHLTSDAQIIPHLTDKTDIPSSTSLSPETSPGTNSSDAVFQPSWLSAGPSGWTSPTGVGNSLQVMILLGVLSLVPAILMMTTCFVRIIVVLGILRQGLGAQGLPPTQVLTALAMFMTLLVMWPVWNNVYKNAVKPYQENSISAEAAWTRGVTPVRNFMITQIERTGNTNDIWLFWNYSASPPDKTRLEQYTAEDVPLHVMIPAFMLSELKTAFLIGVQLLIPFLIIDMLVSAVLMSMGMYMVPPIMISLPFKLMLFVVVDGWNLVVEMLLQSITG